MATIDLGKLYTPQPRQALLHSTMANEILYGGAAGGGKSHSLRWDAYEFCLKNPGCVAVLVRQTLPQLEKNHIRHVRKEIPKELANYNETRKQLIFWNGSILSFQHLEYDKDVNDFQGDEIHWLGLDEAALLQPHHIAEIKSRLRLGSWKPQDESAKKRLPRLVMTSNPGGPSHLYLKDGWLDPAPPETVFENVVEVRGKKIIKTRIFIPATMNDNKFLDEDYEAQFADMPEWKIRQFVDGDWNVVPGAYFDCWDSSKHVIKPFAVPHWWPIYRSCDWGFATPFSIGEWTVSDGSLVVQRDGSNVRHPDGALIRIWEWYGCGEKRNTGLRMDGQMVAEKIVAARGKAKAGPADPSMWRSDSGPSQAERFHRGGINFFKADNQREAGWQEMYRRISRGLLLVTDDCHEFQRTVPTLSSDPMNLDDILKIGEDHIGDECFVAGTLIKTEAGDKPIEQIAAGDRVYTRNGLCRVSHSFSMGERDVFSLSLSNGANLTGTANHPIFLDGRFVDLIAARYGNMARPCTQTSIEKLPDGFGRKLMEKSRRSIIFIISTAIQATTIFQTFSASIRQRIEGFIFQKERYSPLVVSSAESLSSLLTASLGFARTTVKRHGGIIPAQTTKAGNATPAERSTRPINTLRKNSARWIASLAGVIRERRERSSAGTVERALLQAATTLCGAPFVVGRPQPEGRQRVYNLTVETEEEYFANGILVHNCRYMCQARPVKQKRAEPQIPIDAPMRYIHLIDPPQTEERWI